MPGASRFTPGRVTRLHSSLNAAARNLARPSPTRAFTFALSSHESPHWNVEHHYAGKQPIPAVGLTPTGQAAFLAAADDTEFATSAASAGLTYSLLFNLMGNVSRSLGTILPFNTLFVFVCRR